jgi:DnaK suppressor protein
MDPERAQELLARERARIERALANVKHVDVGELSDQDEPADRASDLYIDEFDASLAVQLHRELEAVERAEARLAAGTFGLSVESGERIHDERLEACPWTERTAEEQEEYERSAS